MKNPIRLGLFSVSSPLEVGAGDAQGLQVRLETAFQRAGYDGLELLPSPLTVTDPTAVLKVGEYFYHQRVDAVCAIAASWFEDYLVLDLLEEHAVPVIAWARPGMETGSLCGMQQLGFMLKQLGRPFLFIFDDPEASDAIQRAYTFASAAAQARRLRRARIGLLGHRVEGMTETTPHELALKKTFGPRVVGIDSQIFLERAAAVPTESARIAWEEVKGQVGQVTAQSEAGVMAMQVYQALKTLAAEQSLSAMAVGCYPHLMGKVCLPISLLAEQGFPVACEGDVNGALGMLILTSLTGQPVHNTDLLDPIPADNAIVFSHCGNGAFSLAARREAITLGPVRLMNSGVCSLFPARSGEVTLLNIVPSLEGYRLALIYGQALETDMVFPGNPLRVQFQSPYPDILRWIVEHGLGHHWMGAYGDLRQALIDLAAILGCPLIHCA